MENRDRDREGETRARQSATSGNNRGLKVGKSGKGTMMNDERSRRQYSTITERHTHRLFYKLAGGARRFWILSKVCFAIELLSFIILFFLFRQFKFVPLPEADPAKFRIAASKGSSEETDSCSAMGTNMTTC